jgi:uncharacterized protein (DUF58 family)
MFAPVKAFVRRRMDKWLFQLRGPEAGEVFLNQRRVFIVPAGPGAGFACLLLILLIGSINYNLGLGYALTFTVGTCALVDMVMTFQNLAYLHLAPGRAQSVFAGEEAQFELHVLNRTRRDRYALWIGFNGEDAPVHAVDALAGGSAALVLSAPTTARGWLQAPRVRLTTRFPLGLFRAWSYWTPSSRVLVYPFPEQRAPALPMSGAPSGDGGGHAGHEDFAGIRSYQAGDALRHLAWRQIARLDPAEGGQLVTKHFEGGAVEELVIDFALIDPALDLELRLSRMARWVLDAEQRGLPYAFRIGRHDYPAAQGEAHQAACLRALALYGMPEGGA